MMKTMMDIQGIRVIVPRLDKDRRRMTVLADNTEIIVEVVHHGDLINDEWLLVVTADD